MQTEEDPTIETANDLGENRIFRGPASGRLLSTIMYAEPKKPILSVTHMLSLSLSFSLLLVQKSLPKRKGSSFHVLMTFHNTYAKPTAPKT